MVGTGAKTATDALLLFTPVGAHRYSSLFRLEQAAEFCRPPPTSPRRYFLFVDEGVSNVENIDRTSSFSTATALFSSNCICYFNVWLALL